MINLGYIISYLIFFVYVRNLKDGTFTYLVLYMDDMLIAAKKMFDIHKCKDLLISEFEMKDLGKTKKILGMETFRDREKKKLFL